MVLPDGESAVTGGMVEGVGGVLVGAAFGQGDDPAVWGEGAVQPLAVDVVVGGGLLVFPDEQVFVVVGVVADAGVGLVLAGGGGDGNGRFHPAPVVEQMPPPNLPGATAVLLPPIETFHHYRPSSEPDNHKKLKPYSGRLHTHRLANEIRGYRCKVHLRGLKTTCF